MASDSKALASMQKFTNQVATSCSFSGMMIHIRELERALLYAYKVLLL